MKRATCCQPRKRQPSTSTFNGIFHDQLYGKKYLKINLKITWLTLTILLFSLWSMLDARRRSSTSVNVHFIALFITPKLYYYFLWPQCSCSLPDIHSGGHWCLRYTSEKMYPVYFHPITQLNHIKYWSPHSLSLRLHYSWP